MKKLIRFIGAAGLLVALAVLMGNVLPLKGDVITGPQGGQTFAQKIRPDFEEMLKTLKDTDDVRVIVRYHGFAFENHMQKVISRGAKKHLQFLQTPSIVYTVKKADLYSGLFDDGEISFNVNEDPALTQNIPVRAAVVIPGDAETKDKAAKIAVIDFENAPLPTALAGQVVAEQKLTNGEKTFSSDIAAGIEWAIEKNVDAIYIVAGIATRNCDGFDFLSNMANSAIDRGIPVITESKTENPADRHSFQSPACAEKVIAGNADAALAALKEKAKNMAQAPAGGNPENAAKKEPLFFTDLGMRDGPGGSYLHDFLAYMIEKGTWEAPKSQTFLPKQKATQLFAVQMALAFADIPCSKRSGQDLRTACTEKAIEAKIIPKYKSKPITKFEAYEILLKGADLPVQPGRNLPFCRDVKPGMSMFKTLEQARIYGILKTYSLRGKKGFCLPKRPISRIELARIGAKLWDITEKLEKGEPLPGIAPAVPH